MSFVAEIKDEKMYFTGEIPLGWCRCCLCYDIVPGPMWSCGVATHMICNQCHIGMEKAGGDLRCPTCRAPAMVRNHMLEKMLAPLFDKCALAGRGCDAHIVRGVEHECDFRDVKCAMLKSAECAMLKRAEGEAEGEADRCGMLFAPGDFGTHLAAEHGYTRAESFEFADGTKIVCESKMTPGVFVMARFGAARACVALIDTRVRDAAHADATVIVRDSGGGTVSGKLKVDYIRNGRFGGVATPRSGGVKIISVSINDYFGDFEGGDVWEVDVVRFGGIQTMRVSYVNMARRYVALRAADGHLFHISFGGLELIRRIARGEPEHKRPTALPPMAIEDLLHEWASQVGMDEMLRQIRALQAAGDPRVHALLNMIAQAGPTEEEQIAMALAASMETG